MHDSRLLHPYRQPALTIVNPCRQRSGIMAHPRPEQEGAPVTVTTADKVRFLSSPATYPGSPPVEVRETHMSWVFLAGEYVYKLKKPVRTPFVDFRTLAAREANCREEVRLNRRLAGDVYRGVVALTSDARGQLRLAGAGETVDWLVEMRRLPEERMLDRAIAAGCVQRAEVQRVADLLTGFYRGCQPVAITPSTYVGQFAREHARNAAMLRDARFGLDAATLQRVLAPVAARLDDDRGMLGQRAAEQRIVEGHGDLRPEHVCLNDPPVIIDCLEFSRDLRLVDPIDELTFLALECELLAARWIGTMVMEHYLAQLGERPPAELIAFYWSYRACLRARQALSHLLDPTPRDPDKWLPLARRYLDLAGACALTQRLRAAR